ncbi:ferric-dicitrate binding protein FerR (iron transport regulator) [Sphingomonas trueperi]|uniref:DUF6931 family protein n=1 Tax=Sphingomonas trueperi TaxID=53317 RepID=UPI0033953252
MSWPRTIWAQARQINALLRWPALPGDDAPPDRFFERLRAEGKAAEAALFLGQALPRFEAVLWAAQVAAPVAGPADAAAMAAVQAWLANPAEPQRRAAGTAALQGPPATAATLAASAVFHSGGSIAPPDQPPTTPPREVAGTLAAVAVLAAVAMAGRDHRAALDHALDLGTALARREAETTP